MTTEEIHKICDKIIDALIKRLEEVETKEDEGILQNRRRLDDN